LELLLGHAANIIAAIATIKELNVFNDMFCVSSIAFFHCYIASHQPIALHNNSSVLLAKPSPAMFDLGSALGFVDGSRRQASNDRVNAGGKKVR
jgi:hypothetical protein